MKGRTTHPVVTVGLAMAAAFLMAQSAALAQAGSNVVATGRTGPLPPLERRVSVDVNKVAPRHALGMVARAMGVDLVIDPNVKEPVTMRIARIMTRTALDAICQSIGCSWRLEGRTLHVDDRPMEPESFRRIGEAIRKPLPSSFKFDRAPLRDVLAALSRESGVAWTADAADANVPVTVDLGGQTASEAAMQIARALGWSPVNLEFLMPSTESQEIRLRRGTPADQRTPERVYSIGGGVTAPVPIRTPNPGYTKAAMDAKIQGQVEVEFVVQKDGTVGDVRVIRSLDPGRLDQQAVEAVRQWVFNPGRLNGTPVAVRVQAQLVFNLR
jgi:TonB family protein